MNKEIIKIIPDCIEKIGKYTPATHRDIRKTLIFILPFSVLGGMLYSTYKEIMIDKQFDEIKLQMEHEERMTDKQYKHKEKTLQMKYEHEEKMAEIKVNNLSREEDNKHEKGN